MKEGLLIGGGVALAGVFVGCAAYRLITKKPITLKNTKKKISTVGKKASKMASNAKRAFAEGFEGAQTKVATA